MSYLDVKDKADEKLKRYLLLRALGFYPNGKTSLKVFSEVFNVFGVKIYLIYLLYSFIYMISNRGYFLYSVVKEKAEKKQS
jgi:hypothetical protein